MKDPTPRDPLAEQPEKVPPAEQTEPSLQHPADQSWVLQILLDLKESFGRVDGRTEVQTKRIGELAEELGKVRGEMLTSKGARWLVGIIISVILGVGGLIYSEVARDRTQPNYPSGGISERTKSPGPAPIQPQSPQTSPHERQGPIP